MIIAAACMLCARWGSGWFKESVQSHYSFCVATWQGIIFNGTKELYLVQVFVVHCQMIQTQVNIHK